MIIKRYSAFVSSEYENLKDDRNEVINCLLDHEILPFCMEHFTVPTNSKFEFIKERIDNADIFILLLGDRYGSCDENGISWTQREYEYAEKNGMPMIAIVCPELVTLLKQDPSTYTENQSKQVAFYNKIGYCRAVSSEFTITKILTQFFNSVNLSDSIGWSRNTDEVTGSKFDEWKEKNKAYNIGGIWYHYHLSQKDEKYLRIGKVEITQTFTPKDYRKLKLKGENYSARYDKEKDILKPIKSKISNWEGEYEIKPNGKIFGVFSVFRQFDDKFGEVMVAEGTRRGMHEFTIMDENELLQEIGGSFFDVAPSPKYGKLRLFRTEEDRFEYLKENYEETLLANE